MSSNKKLENHLIRYTEAEWEKAKQMYMNYKSHSEISRSVGMSRPSITSKIKSQKWDVEREMLKSDLLASVSSARRSDFARMTVSSITIISRALEDLAKREAAPSVAEAKRATEILESLDRITRLDDGAPTEITAEKPLVIREVRNRLNKDPFQTVEEIEYEEIEDVEESTDKSS